MLPRVWECSGWRSGGQFNFAIAARQPSFNGEKRVGGRIKPRNRSKLTPASLHIQLKAINFQVSQVARQCYNIFFPVYIEFYCYIAALSAIPLVIHPCSSRPSRLHETREFVFGKF
jgi:hypothetical protein